MSGTEASAKSSRACIAVVGGGIIGLSVAWELSRRGHMVTVFDPASPDRSTSWAAAGMIAPAYEVMIHGGGAGTPLARLCYESAARWAGFARDLAFESGMPVGYRSAPTFALARTIDEKERLAGLAATLADAGHRFAWHGTAEVRDRLGVSAKVQSVLELPDDHQVDNRRVLQAFRRYGEQGGFRMERRAVSSRDELGDRFDAVVWSRGTRETGVEALVKGQALALQPVPGLPAEVLRFGSGYIVPKADRVVIGATSEEKFAHSGVRADTTQALRDAAIAVLPELRHAPVLETWAGLRPKRAGGLPVIGELAPGEFVAAAHYRNGILLAPATASRIADMVEGDAEAEGAFSPHRLQASYN